VHEKQPSEQIVVQLNSTQQENTDTLFKRAPDEICKFNVRTDHYKVI